MPVRPGRTPDPVARLGHAIKAMDAVLAHAPHLADFQLDRRVALGEGKLLHETLDELALRRNQLCSCWNRLRRIHRMAKGRKPAA